MKETAGMPSLFFMRTMTFMRVLAPACADIPRVRPDINQAECFVDGKRLLISSQYCSEQGGFLQYSDDGSEIKT